MKRQWGILAALVAFVTAAAVATVMEETPLGQDQSRLPWCRYPGCYSFISGGIERTETESKPILLPNIPNWELQPRLEEKPIEEAHLPFLQRLHMMALMENSRVKRNARKALPARRRGRQREGTRRVCRGCYSGLTIVAPPAQDGKNMSLMWSHSESGEDSSAGY